MFRVSVIQHVQQFNERYRNSVAKAMLLQDKIIKNTYKYGIIWKKMAFKKGSITGADDIIVRKKQKTSQ